MPNLKKSEVRRLPEPLKPVSEHEQRKPDPAHRSEPEVVRSEDPVNDIELCRSVSIRDRKKMFEYYANRSNLADGRQWLSLPSLEHRQDSPQSLEELSNIRSGSIVPEPEPEYTKSWRAESPFRPASTDTFHRDKEQGYSRSRRGDSSYRPTSTPIYPQNPEYSSFRSGASPFRPASIASFYPDQDHSRSRRGESSLRPTSNPVYLQERGGEVQRFRRGEPSPRPSSTASTYVDRSRGKKPEFGLLRPASSGAHYHGMDSSGYRNGENLLRPESASNSSHPRPPSPQYR